MIESQEHKEDLIKIAKKLIRKPHSVPTDENEEPTETYIEYLSLMYNPEIAKIVQHLPVFPAMVSMTKFAKLLKTDKMELTEKLNVLARKKFVLALGNRYALPDPLIMFDAPFIVKENYEGADIKKFADLSRKFFIEDKYYKKWETSYKGTPYMRVLTVNEQIDPSHEIMPIEEVYSILDKHSSFTLFDCPCRLRAGISGVRECTDKYPLHNCINLGANADLMAQDPGAERISKEEAKNILKQSVEAGLVLTTDNTAKFANLICSCCECCCGMLRGLTRFDNPRAIAKANFIADVDTQTCVGCETCLSRCKFGAITVETVANINEDKCMGCGLCAATCPEEAITMKRMERESIPHLGEVMSKQN